MAAVNRGTMFPPTILEGMINKVKGKSSLAYLSAATPVAFNGNKAFTFSFDKEVDLVDESAAKTSGGVTIAPVTVVPYKVEYSGRFSDEFIFGSEDYRLDILRQFADGFSKKVARGLDIMAFHGRIPRTAAKSALIGANNFDDAVTATLTKTASADADIESAISILDALERDFTGIAMATSFRSALASEKDNAGRRLYPEISWGQNTGNINGVPVSANSTLSFGASGDVAIIGDFASAVRWGYAREVPIEVIEYGNPDNDTTLGDLKGRNQVLLRGEVYIGWGILDTSAFVRIVNS